MVITVDGSESQTVLPNLTPGVTYRVSVISVKGLQDSEPASDTVTTGTIHTQTDALTLFNNVVVSNVVTVKSFICKHV